MSAPNELSFLPDDYLDRKRQRRTNVICAVVFAIVMGTIGTTFSFSERSLRAVEKQHASIEAEYSDAAKRIEQVQQLLNKQRTMSRQAEITASLLEKVPRSNILAEITNALPANVSLTDFVLETKKSSPAPVAAAPKPTFEVKGANLAPKPAAAPPVDVFIKVSGLAVTDIQVSQFITKMNQCKIFKDVNLLITESVSAEREKNEPAMRKFQIELTLNPDIDIQAITEPKTAAVEIK
jgi:Tfp pilus assembly protein PilN